MSNAAALLGISQSAVGDLRFRAAPLGMSPETLYTSPSGEEWLRSGFVVSYAAKYASLANAPASRKLYGYTLGIEQVVSSTIQYGMDFNVYHDGTRYVFAHIDSANNGRMRTKTAFDSGASEGTATGVINGWGSGFTPRGVFMIQTGANAGRYFIAGNSALGGGNHIQYTSGTGGTWSAVNTSVSFTGGGFPHVIGGKPDGSLLVAVAETMANTYGSGNIYTSTDGGVNWTARTASNTTLYYPSQLTWCASLGKFIYVATNSNFAFLSTPDGYTNTLETGTPYYGSASYKTCSVADNGSAAIVLGASSNIFRSVSAGAFASVSTPRQLVSICNSGSNFYACNSLGGIEISSDNGTTWTELGQPINYSPAPFNGLATRFIRAANGNVFVSNSGNWLRFTGAGNAAPTLTPDSVGLANKVQTAFNYPAYGEYYARIL